MPTYLLTLAYDGTKFSGWQVQRRYGKVQGRTVQAECEKILKNIPGFTGKLTYSSRTDAGVHADAQAVSFTLRKHITADVLIRRLNALFPDDIAPRTVKIVPDGFNARYKALKKEYIYTIYNSPLKPVMDRHAVLWWKTKLDCAKMRRAARYFIGTHDFMAFAGRHVKRESTKCTIHNISVKQKREYITVSIIGNRFLYNMVRFMVGTLIEAGRGKIEPKTVKSLLNTPTRTKAGSKAPAHGLRLHKVYFSG